MSNRPGITDLLAGRLSPPSLLRSSMKRDPSRPMRIGIVTDSLLEHRVGGEARIANGGVGVYIHELAHHLLETDNDNEYFLIRFGPGLLDIYRHPRAHNIFLPSTRISRALALLGVGYSRVARENRLDLVHFPNLFGGQLLSPAVKQVTTVQDLTPFLFPSLHPRHRVVANRLFARRALRRCDRVIVPSQATARDLVDSGFAPDLRCVRIPHGVNPVFKPISKTPGFAARHPPDRPFILNVGVLEPRKNHLLLLEVLRQLHRRGHRLELILIGRPGWRWKDPLAMQSYRDLWPWVRVLADLSDSELVEYYNRAEMFIYPSFYEGFGLPLLEAMACGTPVIASRSSSLPEVGGSAALYADPNSPDEFVTQALRILGDSELRQQLIATGLRHSSKFTWQAAARATVAVYHSACESPDDLT